MTIPDDGEDHNTVVTADGNRTSGIEEQFNIQAPLNLKGDIFSITSNQTRPEGPFVMSGSFALQVSTKSLLTRLSLLTSCQQGETQMKT